MKTAVVLLNLGGPTSLEAVKPFLFNLFNDRAIINLPNPLRYLVAKLISSRRAAKARHIYEQMGGFSPLLNNTKAQQKALQEELGNQFKVFIGMRYWVPFIKDIVQDVREYNPSKIILLPLYPQFSTTTTASSFTEWDNQAKDMEQITQKICCYPQSDHFIHAHCELIIPHCVDMLTRYNQKPMVLFSAHGLPKKVILAGDPYQWQVEKSVKKILEFLTRQGFDAIDHMITYQSRVGPMEWLKPATDEVIKNHGKTSPEQPLMIVPITFVSEHSETLVELDIEYKDLAKESGVQHYYRAPTLSLNKSFIQGLAQQVHDCLHGVKKERICPDEFTKCPCVM